MTILNSTQASIVYDEIKRDIVKNKLKPGEKLAIDAISRKYNVGPTPLREALNRLSSEGLVNQQDQKGFRVSLIGKDELIELTKARKWILEIALRDSIINGDESWEEGILLSHRRLSRFSFAQENDGALNPKWESLHRAFHFSLISACSSNIIKEMESKLFDAADRYRNLACSFSGESIRDVSGEHSMLMDLVLEKDIPGAVNMAQCHIEKTTQSILDLLRENLQNSVKR
jgi:DNA-binding GntR family transcriptional regulator